MSAVQLLLDRAALHDLMMRYAAGVDRRDMDLVASCFTPDVDASAWGFTDRDSLIAFISGVSHFHTTMHMMGNQFIEVDGDEASMDTYAMLTHQGANVEGEPFELNMSGNRYVEKLRRDADGEWVIYERGGDPRWAPRGVTAEHTDDAAVQWLLDRAEIHDLLMHYALAIDLRDWDRVRSCFAPQFDARYGPMRFADHDALIDFVKGVEHFASTTHFLGTQLIEVDGDRALAETVAMITHRESKDGEQTEWTTGGGPGGYIDEFVRVDGRWRIRNRGEQCARVPTGRAVVPRSHDPAVQWLLDRAEIHDVVAVSAVAMDRRDWDLYRSCLGPDSGVSVDELRTHLEQWHSTQHFLGNQLIEFDVGGDEAMVETYVYVTHRDSESSLLPSAWSNGARRFVDRVTRVDGRWRISERQFLTNRVESRVESGGSS